jgi:Kdo2-lipid IVA lauroyltransferase/acyltransferase
MLLRWMATWPLPLVHALGAALGWGVYAASPTYRQRLRDNAAQAGLDVSTRRQAVAHAGRMVGELPYLWLRPRTQPLGARLLFDDASRALVEETLRQGRGLVLMTPHLGAFEVTAQAYAEHFGQAHPLTAMYRPARKAWLRDVQIKARDRPGLLTAPASLAGIRQMMRALRRGDTVGLLPDQVPPDGMGVWAPYFGRDAYTMTLAARLIQQTGATALLLTGERLPGGQGFRVRADVLPEALPSMQAVLVPAAGATEDAANREQKHHVACATSINRAMEMLVRRHPAQYLWGYHRYKAPRGSAATPGPPQAEPSPPNATPSSTKANP